MTWVAIAVAGGAAATSATIAGAQAIKGKRDQKRAEKNRPKYEIPQEAYDNLNQAQQASLQGLPEAQKQQYLNNLQQSSAYALQQTANRKGGLTGVVAINQQQNQGIQNLAVNDAQARINNQQQLFNYRNQMADYKGQSFQLNKLNPYYENLAQKQARNAALFQNLSNGANMFGSSLGGLGGGGGQGGGISAQQSGGGNMGQVQYKMDPYQMDGFNQNTTPNPFGNQQALNSQGLSGGSVW